MPGRDMVARLPELEVRRLRAAGVRVDGVAPLRRSVASDAVPASALRPRQSASLALWMAEPRAERPRDGSKSALDAGVVACVG